MNGKFKFSMISLLAIAAIVLSACGAPASGAPQSTTAPGATTCMGIPIEANAKITFAGWGDQTEQQVYRDSITRFNQVCPTVSVDYTPIPSNFQDKLKAQMAGGTAPDVFYVDSTLMTAFAPSGQLLPLDSYMQQAGVKRSDFIPSLLSIFTLNGKTYGLPKDWGTLGLIYLPEAFTAAGIPEPTSNWTWNDLATAAQKIATSTKYKGFCQNPDEARFAPFVLSDGGSYTTPDYKTATLDTTPVKTMATFLLGMLNNGSLVQASDVGASWCGEAIGKQLVAMTLEGGWMVNFMNQSYPNVQWKAVEIPQGPKTRADFIFTNAIGVNASTKYPKASAAFTIFLTSPQNQGAIEKTGFAYSTHPDQIAQVVNPNDHAIAQGGLLPASVSDYWGPCTGQVDTAVSNALQRIYLKSQTVDQSFAQAQQEVQSALNSCSQ